MSKKIDRAILSPMKLAKIVRESAGLNAWTMKSRMNKRSIQAYLSMERSAKRITLEDFYMLEKIWVDEKCGTLDEFHAKARSLVKKGK